MTVQDRARSVAALRVAPRVVVQIVEDTLAQSGAAHEDLLSNPLTRAWQTEALLACSDVTTAHFPFAEGETMPIRPLLRGSLPPEEWWTVSFAPGPSRCLIPSENPWRWKPEARLPG